MIKTGYISDGWTISREYNFFLFYPYDRLWTNRLKISFLIPLFNLVKFIIFLGCPKRRHRQTRLYFLKGKLLISRISYTCISNTNAGCWVNIRYQKINFAVEQFYTTKNSPGYRNRLWSIFSTLPEFWQSCLTSKVETERTTCRFFPPVITKEPGINGPTVNNNYKPVSPLQMAPDPL